MAEAHSKLFHAIVGLGLAAAGCDGKTLTASADASVHSSTPDARRHDARDVAVMSEPPMPEAGRHDAVVAHDAAVDAPVDAPIDAGIDAQDAQDAAHDVMQPPPPPPVK